MPKQQHIVKLTGFTKADLAASSHNASDVRSFQSSDKKFIVRANADGTVTLYTAKGSYVMTKHMGANRYQTIANNTRIHFCPKKIVATLIYWA